MFNFVTYVRSIILLYCEMAVKPKHIDSSRLLFTLIQAQRDLTQALGDAGYLNLRGADLDGEERLAGYWFDNVYTGFYMRPSENAIPEAMRR